MSPSNVSTRKPEAWFPIVSKPSVPPLVELTTSVVGKFLELGFSAMARNIERDLSSLQSLAQVRDLKSLLEQPRKYAKDFWRDQEQTLDAAARLLKESFDQALAPADASEAVAAKRVDRPDVPTVAPSRSEPANMDSVPEAPERKAAKDSIEDGVGVSTIFEIYLDKADEYRFRLKSSDGTVLLRSEGYTSRSSAVKGIASVKKNASDDARYAAQMSATGKPVFNLKAGNHQVIGSSTTFASAEQMEAAIRIIKQTAASSTVDDQTRTT